MPERIPVLDVLRGFAILGMFVAHLSYFRSTTAGPNAGAATVLVERAVNLFFDGSFYAIFCILFGAGFAVQFARAEARGDRFVPRYLRRLLALGIFGFILDGVFRYNVLFPQAIWGLPLLFVRRWPIHRLIVLLFLCAASRPLYDLGRLAVYSSQRDGLAQLAAANQQAEQRFVTAWEKVEAAEATGNWPSVVAARIEFMPEYFRRSSILPGENLTFFLLGMIAFRIGLFERPGEHRRLIAAFMIGGAISWAIASWVLPIGAARPSPHGHGLILDAATELARTNGFMLVRKQWLMFTYVGTILLLIARRVSWLPLLTPLRFAGRMALTNYVLHVVLLELVFSRHGFGLTLPTPMVPVAAVLLFAAQAVASQWWLSRFTGGPLEWLWRCFTYWGRRPLRREVAAA